MKENGKNQQQIKFKLTHLLAPYLVNLFFFLMSSFISDFFRPRRLISASRILDQQKSRRSECDGFDNSRFETVAQKAAES